MKTDLHGLNKLSQMTKAQVAVTLAANADKRTSRGILTVDLSVEEPHYVPAQVRVHARVSPVRFTGFVDEVALAQVQADPKVRSVSVPRQQRLA